MITITNTIDKMICTQLITDDELKIIISSLNDTRAYYFGIKDNKSTEILTKIINKLEDIQNENI